MTDFDDMSLLELFQMESDSLLLELDPLVLALEEAEKAEEALTQMARVIHTIKGSSGTVMANDVNAFAHALEDHLNRLKQQTSMGRLDVDYMLTATDWLKVLIQRAVNEEAPLANIDSLTDAVKAGKALDPLPGQPPDSADRESPPEIENGVTEKKLETPPEEREGPAAQTESGSSIAVDLDMLPESDVLPDSKTPPFQPGGKQRTVSESQRISVRRLDRLFNLAGELYVKCTGMEQIKKEMYALLKSENSSDLKEKLTPIVQNFDEFEMEFKQLTNSLKEEVMLARMVPLAQLFDSFPRIVRELAQSLDKSVQLMTNGADTRIDKALIELLKAPLEHMIRNAIDHGIESPDERREQGKPVQGILSLSASQQGDEVVIQLKDDGKGIDPEKIRTRVVEQKRLSADQARHLKSEELLDFLFLPSFSTRDQVSKVSGRGVGMDVVKTGVDRINGKVNIESIPGQFTAVTLRLPMTLAVLHTVLLECERVIYAFTSSMIEEYIHLDPENIESIGGKTILHHQDRIMAVIWLSHLFGESGPLPMQAGQIYPALVLRSSETWVAIVGDRFMGESEIVVKALDSRLKKVRNLTGATLLNNGRVALVIDVLDLLNTVREFQTSYGARKSESEEPKTAKTHVLVVEDSLTIRTMERKLLESQGYEVTVAVDGLDGLNKVRRQKFDLILTDVDMPRMNGLELTRTLKSDQKYQQIPIVIVSYKDRQEDKKRGMEVGADHYIAKSQFNNNEFLESIRRLI
ncbi:MAG: hybrid sensor histidine kinase/response regulator [SAR324 cluster bacterium]|nr:hybrid sensor histidine kinase/response regulator [SAR324 cluster bacterium]